MARTGRPKIGDGKNLECHFRMSAEENEILSQAAELTGMPKADVIRKALFAYYEAVKNKEDFVMARTTGTVTVPNELRLCKVKSELGYFHCWEHFSKPVPAGLTVGSAPAGVISYISGIVEFDDGIRRVDPTEIKFCDEEHANLCALNKHQKEMAK